MKRRRPGSNGTAPNNGSHASDSDAKRTASQSGDQSAEPFEFECPCCGKLNTARIGQAGAWLTKCFKCELDEMADAVGCSVWELLEDAPRWLELYAAGRTRRRREVEPAPLPSEHQIREWREAHHAPAIAPGSGGNGASTEQRSTAPSSVGMQCATASPTRFAPHQARWSTSPGVRRAGVSSSPPGWGPKARLRGRTAARGELRCTRQPLPQLGGLLVEGETDALLARQHACLRSPASPGRHGTRRGILCRWTGDRCCI